MDLLNCDDVLIKIGSITKINVSKVFVINKFTIDIHLKNGVIVIFPFSCEKELNEFENKMKNNIETYKLKYDRLLGVE